MPILTWFVAFPSLLLALACLQSPANHQPSQPPQHKKSRQVWLRLKAGPILNGDLVKMDNDSIDFTVREIFQSVPCDDLIAVMFVSPTSPTLSPTLEQDALAFSPPSEPVVFDSSGNLHPTILYREKAAYTPKAKSEKIQGTVVLGVVFHQNGRIENINVIRGLPYGLSDQAILAANKIRFIPAMKDGKPVSVRGNLEFAFNLY